MVSCAPVTVAARVRGPLRERLVEIYFSPFNIAWRLCISRGSCDHVNGGAVSLTLGGT